LKQYIIAKDTTERDENFIVAVIALSRLVNNVHKIKSIGIVKTRYLHKKINILLRFLEKILANMREIIDMNTSKLIFFIIKAKIIKGINKINFT